MKDEMDKSQLSGSQIIKAIEKCLLSLIAVLTLVAVAQELMTVFQKGKVELADLLLLFIYTEVLGMIGIFYLSNRIPITLPLFVHPD